MCVCKCRVLEIFAIEFVQCHEYRECDKEDCIRTCFLNRALSFFTKTCHGFFSRSSFIVGRTIDTIYRRRRRERPSIRFSPHIPRFHSATTLAFATKRGEHRERKRKESKKWRRRNEPKGAFSFPGFSQIFLLFRVSPPVSPRRFSLPISPPPDAAGPRDTVLASRVCENCFNTSAVSSGAILSKIRFEHTSS